jgi:hypothetical protein
VEVDFTLVITPNPTVTANPPSIGFQYNIGSTATTPTSQPFVLSSTFIPGGNIGFSATPSSTGNFVLLNGGTSTVYGCITATGMVAATYNGAFTCSATPLVLTTTIATASLTIPNSTYNGAVAITVPTGGGNPVVTNAAFNIPVTVTTSPAPSITFNPSVLPSFFFTLGQTVETDPASQTSVVTLIGKDSYNLTPSADWVVVTPNAGIQAATQTVTVSINPLVADFPTTAGTYNYTITPTSTTGSTYSTTITGTLVVAAMPTVGFTPASPITKVYYAGDADSADVPPFMVAVSVTNTPQNPTYALTATPNAGSASWCTVTNPGNVNNSGGSMTVTLKPFEAGLTANSSCTITVAGAGVTSGTFTINLTVIPQSLNNPGTQTFNMPTNATSPSVLVVPMTGLGSFTFNTTPTLVTPIGGTPWLASTPVTLVSGAGNMTLTATESGTDLTTPGTYGSTVAYQGPANNAVLFNTAVYLNVGTIAASPTSVTWSHTLGYTTPVPTTIALSSLPATGLAFTVVTAPASSWLTCSANPLTTPSTLTVSYNPAGLTAAASPYTGSCTIKTTNSTNTLTIPVTLNVTSQPTLASSLGGGNNPVINLTGVPSTGVNPTYTFTLTAAGLPAGGTIPFTVSNLTSVSGFLTVAPGGVSPTSGTVGAAGTPLTITVNMAALAANTAPGNQLGSFTISSPNSANTLTVSVVLTVSPVEPFFATQVNVGSGVDYMAFLNGTLFGYYAFTSGSASTVGAWLDHQDMGYEYVLPADFQGNVYMYDLKSGHWFYTGITSFPYLYDFTLKAWLYYYPSPTNSQHYSSNPRYFYNFGTSSIITM